MSAQRLHPNRLATALIVAVLALGVLELGSVVGLAPPGWPSVHSFLTLSMHEAPAAHRAGSGQE